MMLDPALTLVVALALLTRAGAAPFMWASWLIAGLRQ